MAEPSLRYRRLDPQGDMVLGNGSGIFLTGVEAMRQAISTRLKLLQGEWWERPQDGLPLFQQMLGKPATQAQKELMDLLITERIMDTKLVEGVEAVQSEMTGRAYAYSAAVRTAFGETSVEVRY